MASQVVGTTSRYPEKRIDNFRDTKIKQGINFQTQKDTKEFELKRFFNV